MIKKDEINDNKIISEEFWRKLSQIHHYHKFFKKYFEIKIDFNINEINKIKLLKECILKKKNKNDDFEFYVNDVLYYKNLYGKENNYIRNKSNFDSNLINKLKTNGFLKISFLLYNVNLEENLNFKEFEVNKIELLTYSFKNQKLNHILRKKNMNI